MVWRAPSKTNTHHDKEGGRGTFNNHRGDGKFHSTNEQSSYNKGWKTNRWADGNEASQARYNKEKENDNGWRKVGASGKAESYGSRFSKANDSGADVNDQATTSTDGWTKVKNPFAKNDN